MSLADFDINADGGDQGYDADASEALVFTLRNAVAGAGIRTWKLQVFAVADFDETETIATNPPRASKQAPTLVLHGATTGQSVSPSSITGSITATAPADELVAYILRSTVNGGKDARGRLDPTLVRERMIVRRDAAGLRTIVATETYQYETAGWAGAIDDLVRNLGAAGGLAFLRRTLIRAGTGTHTCGADATHARLRGGGGGGAGGGANAAAGEASIGACASAAGVFDVLIELSAGLDIPYVVGAGGVAVIGGTGGDGNDTTATYDGVTYAGRKGLGSIATASGTSLLFLGCVPGGIAENGDQNITGGPGGFSVRESGTSGLAGNGGDSAEAPGGVGASSPLTGSISNDGQDGQFSSGGGGAVNFNNSPAAGNKGGAGGVGFLWVYEFRSQDVR